MSKEKISSKNMWEGVPREVYSDTVWRSVKKIEPFLSDLDRQWNEALAKVAKQLGISSKDSTKIPYFLEGVTLKRAKELGRFNFVTLSGPGAVGKGTVRKLIPIEKNTINDTTRAPRGDGDSREKDGVQYFFIDEVTLNSRKESGQYVYEPVFKPGRGYYALQKSQLDDLIAAGERFVVDDNIPVARMLRKYVSKEVKENVNPLHIYLLPPAPIMATLALRTFARAEETNDSRYVKEGTIEIPYGEIESTIGERQVSEFAPVSDLITEGGNVLFVVNDDLARMRKMMKEIYSW